MTNKDIEKLLNEYTEEMNNNNPDYWRSREEYIQVNVNSYKKHCENNEDFGKRILVWVAILDNPKMLGIYEAFLNKDMELLNNVLYQAACIEQIRDIFFSEYDHSYYAMNILPELLAANMVSRIPVLLPETHGMSKNGYTVGISIINLFMALWYNRDDFVKTAKENAKKALAAKRTIMDKAIISYLLALLEKDCNKASEYLSLVCKGAKKSCEYNETRFSKSFCIMAHGLYNLSHYVFNGELDGKVKMPNESNFSQDLALWQKENNYKEGDLFLKYPEPIQITNTILKMIPPQTSLKLVNNKYYQDTEAFKEKIVEKVIISLK